MRMKGVKMKHIVYNSEYKRKTKTPLPTKKRTALRKRGHKGPTQETSAVKNLNASNFVHINEKAFFFPPGFAFLLLQPSRSKPVNRASGPWTSVLLWFLTLRIPLPAPASASAPAPSSAFDRFSISNG
jgi:hypothetical protein